MLFFDKKEINYEAYNLYTVKKVWSNKQNVTNKYLINIKPRLQIYFWFKKIKEDNLDFLKLFNHLIFLWLITSQKAYIYNLGSVLARGIKYFRCIFALEIKYIYLFINFLNEFLMPIMQKNAKNTHYKTKNIYLCSFSDFSNFTNLRLSSNFYLNSIHDKLFMFMKMKNNLNMYSYLTCLKI